MRVQDQKSGISRLNLHVSILEGKSIGLDQKKKELEMRANDLDNQYAKLGSKARSNSTQGEIQKSLSKSTLAFRKLRKTINFGDKLSFILSFLFA
jgi:hypothetical protein